MTRHQQLEQWKTELIDELEGKGASQQKTVQIKALEAELNQLKKVKRLIMMMK